MLWNRSSALPWKYIKMRSDSLFRLSAFWFFNSSMSYNSFSSKMMPSAAALILLIFKLSSIIRCSMSKGLYDFLYALRPSK